MKTIVYRVTLLEPVLVTALDGDPNSAVTYEFLPGSVLRGAVIKRYCARQDCQPADLLDKSADALRLFFDGTTRYLNGYVMAGGQRALPTPLAWHKSKAAESGRAYNFAVTAREQHEATGKDDEKVFRDWKPLKEAFHIKQDNKVQPLKVARRMAVHTARNRRMGRAALPEAVRDGEEAGAVFRYEALEAGQTFEAAIVCDRDDDAAIIKPLLSGEVLLGGSRTGGYGRARLDVVDDAAGWRESTAEPSQSDRLVVTLVSDALVRDANGQSTADAEAVRAAIEQRLGLPEGDLKFAADRVHGAFVRVRPVAGFNRKWGLPLPQGLAVQMGSVLVLTKPALTLEQIDARLAQGIGERRAEGFGRVAVNWHSAEWYDVLESMTIMPAASEESEPEILSAVEAQTLLTRVTDRAARQRRDRDVVAEAYRFKLENPPKSAQASRLRNIIADELLKAQPAAERIRQFLKQVDERSTARKQFARARVNGLPLKDWIEQTLNRPDVEEALRLIDAVLLRMVKLDRKEAVDHG